MLSTRRGKAFRAEVLEDGRKRPCIISLREAMATSLTEEDEASCCERSSRRDDAVREKRIKDLDGGERKKGLFSLLHASFS